MYICIAGSFFYFYFFFFLFHRHCHIYTDIYSVVANYLRSNISTVVYCGCHDETTRGGPHRYLTVAFQSIGSKALKNAFHCHWRCEPTPLHFPHGKLSVKNMKTSKTTLLVATDFFFFLFFSGFQPLQCKRMLTALR